MLALDFENVLNLNRITIICLYFKVLIRIQT